MSNYESKDLNETDLIVSKKEDRILETHEGSSQFINEFKKNQNDILVKYQDISKHWMKNPESSSNVNLVIIIKEASE